MNAPDAIFDRSMIRRRRARAAARFADHDFLFREIAERLAERVGDVRRDFALALDAGCRSGLFAKAAQGAIPGKIGQVVQYDLSPDFAALAARDTVMPTLAADDEALPFAPASFDLVASCAVLHAVNDVPGALIQLRQALKPDGLFVGAILGGETLHELRHALIAAEAEVEGGASP
ncbi:MAG: methyltransferase domain-containing protein, partial [Alphaproteobacteria bacterium]|nr:methyltransferase domain-containing protein [Alphaproteobacteria bacterium]